MPTASARGVKAYIRLKGRAKAKEFQKINMEDWLSKNVKGMFSSE